MDPRVTDKSKQELDLCRPVAEASSMPMVAVEGVSHTVRYVNPAFCLLVGKSKQELLGNAFSGAVPAGHQCLSLLDRVYRTGQAETYTGQEPSASHPLGWSYAMWPVLVADDRPVGIIIQVTETAPSRQQAMAMSQALMISSVRQHELTEAADIRTDDLNRSLKEREVLLQEVHHRVKNNLQVVSSLLNMQMRRLEDDAARDAFDNCQTRIQAIALIHEKLYQSKDYSRVSFADYVRSLAANIFHVTRVSPASISLDVAIEDVSLTVDKAIPCGLIVNELIMNALKHAFPEQRHGKVRVEIAHADAGRVRMIVKDDGLGLPAGLDVQRSDSLGLQLVCTLAKQLEATMDVQSQGGSSFEFTFRGGD